MNQIRDSLFIDFERGDGNSNIAIHRSRDIALVGDSLGSLHAFSFLEREWKEFRIGEGAISSCCVSQKSGVVIIGIGNEVLACDLNDLEVSSHPLLERRVLPLSHCEFNPSESLIITSSEDPDIHLYDSSHSLLYKIRTNEIGVKTFSSGPDSLVAFVDLSGGLFIRKLLLGGGLAGSLSVVGADAVHQCAAVASLDLIRHKQHSLQLSWHPSLPILVVPSKFGSMLCLSVAQGGQWRESFIGPADDTAKTDVHLAAFSPCGTFLLSCDTSGLVALWRVSAEGPGLPSFSLLQHSSLGEAVSHRLKDAVWTADGRGVMLTTASSWALVSDILSNLDVSPAAPPAASERVSAVPLSSPSATIAATEALSDAPAEKKRLKGKKLEKKAVTVADSDSDADWNDDEDAADEAGNISLIKKAAASRVKPAAASSSSSSSSPDKTSRVVDDLDDDDEDDVVSLHGDDDALEQGQGQGQGQGMDSQGRHSTWTLHPPVQISSTKLDEKMRRYMVWNSHGSITTRIESVFNRIEIRFANTAGRNKQVSFEDNLGFTMAAMSYEGAVFATDSVQEEVYIPGEASKKLVNIGSTLQYHPFPAGTERLRGANEAFTVRLPDEEAAVGVAAGCGWVAVATSKSYLRVFSSTGLQLSVTWLKGPVVCLCAHDLHLAVVYNSAVVGNQSLHQLSVDLIEVKPNDRVNLRVASSSPVPLSAGSSLEWCGFSIDSLVFHVMDMQGVVSMFVAQAACWVPVLDANAVRKSVDHKYWPIAVYGDKLAYVLLNGESKPSIYPQPVVTNRLFRVPICEMKDSKEINDFYSKLVLDRMKSNQLELQMLSASESVDQLEDLLKAQQIEADRTLLKLFQEACRLKQIAKACDIAQKISTDRALAAAVTVANHFGRSAVAQKVEEILQFRQQQAESEQPATEEYSYSTGHTQVEASQGNSSSNRSNTSRVNSASVGPASLGPDSATASVPLPAAKVVAVNPFARQAASSDSSPSKKRPFAVQDLKQTPSPKRVQLSRQSSFSQEARSKKSNDRAL